MMTRPFLVKGVVATVAMAFAAAALVAQQAAPKSLPASAPQSSSAPAAAEYDAQYVRMEVPAKVTTDQVFLAKVTMKNTGTQSWAFSTRTHTSLRCWQLDEDMTWGTSYMIEGQGKTVAPGQEFTFVSWLRAPSKPGQHPFQWKVSGQPGFFGQATQRATITVDKRPQAATVPTTLPAPDATGKAALTFDDFEYLGSFRVPPKVGQGGAGYSESGLALRKAKDGGRRLFMNFNHPAGTLFEVEIPDLVKLDGQNYRELNQAKVSKEWGKIATGGKFPNGGFWWDDDKQTLLWTWYDAYYAGGPTPTLAACKLADDGSITYSGPWTVPSQKWHWGGATILPKAFADKYSGGRTLALGFGGYYSICGPASRGPSLGAIAWPDPSKKEVDLTPLLGYKDPACAPRDGNYFYGQAVGFWHRVPEDPAHGAWTWKDECRTGVFIDLPDKHGYIAFVKLGTGRLGYDYARITEAGSAQWWYFYNPADLGQVAKGTRKSSDVLPYLMAKDSAVQGLATGACFDDQQRKLYVYRKNAYPVNRESHPLVHVYRVKLAGERK